MRAFANVHPAVSMTYFLSVLLISMFLPHPILQTEALIGGALFCATLKKRGRAGDIGFYLILFVMIAITNPLFSHNGVTILFFLNGNPMTFEAFLYGISLAGMVVGVLLWCKAYSEIMTSDKFLYLFGKAVPKLSLVLSTALRFIPAYLRMSRQVGRAQKAMGLYAGKSLTDRVKNRMRVLAALVAWSLENAMDTSASMKARGYGQKGRTSFSLFRFRRSDGILLGACIFLLALPIVGAALGVTKFNYYPRVDKIETSFMALVIYTAFGLLSLLPFILEVKEAVLWKYYRSKI